jgi:hypothetical protein
MDAVVEKHLRYLEAEGPTDQRAAARYGLLRRLAVVEQTRVHTTEARRLVLAAWRADPWAALKDARLSRILIASFLPHSVLESRRHMA